MKGPAENIDLSAGRNRLSLLEYVTIVESRFGNDRENTRGAGGWNHSTWCEWCACSATVITITMLKIFLGPFIDDGCCLRMWSSHHILLVESSSQQLNEMLDGWQRRVKKSFLGGGGGGVTVRGVKQHGQCTHGENTLTDWAFDSSWLSNTSTSSLQTFLIAAACVLVKEPRIFLAELEKSGVFGSV